MTVIVTRTPRNEPNVVTQATRLVTNFLRPVLPPPSPQALAGVERRAVPGPLRVSLEVYTGPWFGKRLTGHHVCEPGVLDTGQVLE